VTKADLANRVNVVRSIYKDGRIDARRGSSYPDPGYDEFVTVYDDQLVIKVKSRGKTGEEEVERVRDFVEHAIHDIESLLAENARLRLKLKRAGKRVSALVAVAKETP